MSLSSGVAVLLYVGLFSLVEGLVCPEGNNVAQMCVPGTYTASRVLIDTVSYRPDAGNCTCSFTTTSSSLKIVTYVAPNYAQCNSAIRLSSSSGNTMRFQCLMSGTYLDTSINKEGTTSFETYADIYDNNYCLVLEQAGSVDDTVTVTCTVDNSEANTTEQILPVATDASMLTTFLPLVANDNTVNETLASDNTVNATVGDGNSVSDTLASNTILTATVVSDNTVNDTAVKDMIESATVMGDTLTNAAIVIDTVTGDTLANDTIASANLVNDSVAKNTTVNETTVSSAILSNDSLANGMSENFNSVNDTTISGNTWYSSIANDNSINATLTVESIPNNTVASGSTENVTLSIASENSSMPMAPIQTQVFDSDLSANSTTGVSATATPLVAMDTNILLPNATALSFNNTPETTVNSTAESIVTHDSVPSIMFEPSIVMFDSSMEIANNATQNNVAPSNMSESTGTNQGTNISTAFVKGTVLLNAGEDDTLKNNQAVDTNTTDTVSDYFVIENNTQAVENILDQIGLMMGNTSSNVPQNDTNTNVPVQTDPSLDTLTTIDTQAGVNITNELPASAILKGEHLPTINITNELTAIDNSTDMDNYTISFAKPAETSQAMLTTVTKVDTTDVPVLTSNSTQSESLTELSTQSWDTMADANVEFSPATLDTSIRTISNIVSADNTTDLVDTSADNNVTSVHIPTSFDLSVNTTESEHQNNTALVTTYPVNTSDTTQDNTTALVENIANLIGTTAMTENTTGVLDSNVTIFFNNATPNITKSLEAMPLTTNEARIIEEKTEPALPVLRATSDPSDFPLVDSASLLSNTNTSDTVNMSASLDSNISTKASIDAHLGIDAISSGDIPGVSSSAANAQMPNAISSVGTDSGFATGDSNQSLNDIVTKSGDFITTMNPVRFGNDMVTKPSDSTPFGNDMVSKPSDSRTMLNDIVPKPSDSTPFGNDMVSKPTDSRTMVNDIVPKPSESTPFGNDMVSKPTDSRTMMNDIVPKPSDSTPFGNDMVSKRTDSRTMVNDIVPKPSDSTPFGNDMVSKSSDSRTMVNDIVPKPSDSTPFGNDMVSKPTDSRTMVNDIVPKPSDSTPFGNDMVSKPTDSRTMVNDIVPKPSDSTPFGNDMVSKPSDSRTMMNDIVPKSSDSTPFGNDMVSKPSDSRTMMNDIVPKSSDSTPFGNDMVSKPSDSRTMMNDIVPKSSDSTPFGNDMVSKPTDSRTMVNDIVPKPSDSTPFGNDMVSKPTDSRTMVNDIVPKPSDSTPFGKDMVSKPTDSRTMMNDIVPKPSDSTPFGNDMVTETTTRKMRNDIAPKPTDSMPFGNDMITKPTDSRTKLDDMVTKSFDAKTMGNDMVTRPYDMKSMGKDMVTQSFESRFMGNDIVTPPIDAKPMDNFVVATLDKSESSTQATSEITTAKTRQSSTISNTDLIQSGKEAATTMVNEVVTQSSSPVVNDVSETLNNGTIEQDPSSATTLVPDAVGGPAVVDDLFKKTEAGFHENMPMDIGLLDDLTNSISELNVSSNDIGSFVNETSTTNTVDMVPFGHDGIGRDSTGITMETHIDAVPEIPPPPIIGQAPPTYTQPTGNNFNGMMKETVVVPDIPVGKQDDDKSSKGRDSIKNISFDAGKNRKSIFEVNNKSYIIVVGAIAGLVVIATVIGIICHNSRKRRSEKVNISGNGMDPATHQNKAFDGENGDPEQPINAFEPSPHQGAPQTNGGTVLKQMV